MHKEAKRILKEIKAEAKERRTYYVILKNFSPFHNEWARFAQEIGCTDDIWKDVEKLESRHNRFCYYVLEMKPNWKVIERIPFADNSVEVIEQDRWGNKRQRMTEPPKGDSF